jgi:putative copper export protein
MTQFELLKWIHLLAAAVWTGGMIVLAVLVGATRRAKIDIEVLRLMARTFAWVSWVVMAIAILTGFANYTSLGLPWSRFTLKGTLIALSIAIALWHQVTAKRTSPAVRGFGQAVILVLAVLIFGAAVVLI